MSNARRIVENVGANTSEARLDLQHGITGVVEMVEDVNLAVSPDGGDVLLLLPARFLVSDEVDIGGQLSVELSQLSFGCPFQMDNYGLFQAWFSL